MELRDILFAFMQNPLTPGLKLSPGITGHGTQTLIRENDPQAVPSPAPGRDHHTFALGMYGRGQQRRRGWFVVTLMSVRKGRERGG